MNWRKLRSDFKNSDQWYDIFEDWELIEASFATQYNIRLRQDDMPWTEFCTLLSNIMPETPLGQIVTIRSEKDPKILKTFTKEQKRIRNQWLERQACKLKEDPTAYADYWNRFQEMAKAAFLLKKKGGN